MEEHELQALYLFSRGGVALDRLQFASLIEGLAAAANAESQAMLDLLIILAGTDDRPAEELALLVSTCHAAHACPRHTLLAMSGWGTDCQSAWLHGTL